MKKYIDIDSSKRDRTQFPNPNQFDIRFEKRDGNNAFNSPDYICDAYGYERGAISNTEETISIQGTEYSLPFVTDAATTAASFYSTHAASILATHGITVTYDGSGLLTFEDPDADVITISITDVDPSLDGTFTDNSKRNIQVTYAAADGDVSIFINGSEYSEPFDTDTNFTGDGFVSSNATSISTTHGITVTHVGLGLLTFEGPDAAILSITVATTGTSTAAFSDPATRNIQLSYTSLGINLGASASSIDNYYNGSLLEINGELRTIVAYDGTTKAATVDTAFTVPLSGDWVVRRGRPVVTLQVVAVSTASTIVFFGDPGVDVRGMYLYSQDLDETRLITAYDDDKEEVTVSPSFSSNPTAGTNLDILRFSRANDRGLAYTGSQGGRTQYVDYRISLTSLVVPQRTLTNSGGGLVTSRPYLYVEFGNINNMSRTMYGNTSHEVSRALFKVPMANEITAGDFVNLSCKMVQTIKYRPTSDHRFVVRLPNGEILSYEDDYFSPDIPNPKLQTSATFCIEQVRHERFM